MSESLPNHSNESNEIAPSAPTTASRVRLTSIAPEAYRHPSDLQATRALRAVPGFEKAVGVLSRHSLERFLFHEYCASSVRVTPRQCAPIHALLVESCEILDMPEPALFLSQTPIANAFAFGRETPTLVLQTGLVELLTPDELRAVIAHELGHIQCGHSVYRLMWLAILLASRFGGAALGLGDALSMGMQVALLEWMRKAEFSADRAALLVAQDPEIVFSLLFKLTGGSPKVFEMMDRDEYLAQAESYDAPGDGKLDRFYKLLLESEKSHPIPVLRAREALRWGNGPDCAAILAGKYPRRNVVAPVAPKTESRPNEAGACAHCGATLEMAFSFCTSCGRDRLAPVSEPKSGDEERLNG